MMRVKKKIWEDKNSQNPNINKEELISVQTLKLKILKILEDEKMQQKAAQVLSQMLCDD
jgi:hypothetical protein